MWRRSGARQTPRALGWLAWRQKRAGGRAAQTWAVCNCSRMQSQPERVHILRRWRTIRGLTEVTPPDETADDAQGLRLIQQLPPNWVFMVPMGSEVVYAAGRVVMGPGARTLLGVAHPLGPLDLGPRRPISQVGVFAGGKLAWCRARPRCMGLLRVARCSMTRMPQLVHTAVHLQSGMQHGQPGSICVRAQVYTP